MRETWHESEFKEKLNIALRHVGSILATNRCVPADPSETGHGYNDKFALADYLSNTCLTAILTVLQQCGLDDTIMDNLQQTASSSHRAIMLSFTSEEHCDFDRECSRNVESDTSVVHDIHSSSSTTTFSRKVITKITEFFWKFSYSYEFAVTVDQFKAVLRSGSGAYELVSTTKQAPRPKVCIRPSIQVNITDFASQWTSIDHRFAFSIDRSSKKCFTPRRNPQVEQLMLPQLREIFRFSTSLRAYFLQQVFPLLRTEDSSKLPFDSLLNISSVFVPVVALFSQGTRQVLTVQDANELLAAQNSSLIAKLAEVAKTFPPAAAGSQCLVSAAEADFVVLSLHLESVAQHFYDGIQYIEHMLRSQLISAIGKVISINDFAEYMRFHNRNKLFKAEFAPKPFCYSVRRPDHSPEGVITIEVNNTSELICTSVRQRPLSPLAPMKFALNAATTVSIGGDSYIHAWLDHSFSNSRNSGLTLLSRARQFSCFIVLLGRVASATLFQPKFAVILQNKDDLRIPLSMEQIPAPQVFRDAIESLSPEQQRFAKAFRNLQLEGSLFALCIIQIKPALEKVLKLAPDSLTKEIRLTQDLMELFIEYQIPCDLLSFGGDLNEAAEVKLESVRSNVAKMFEMINESKARELREEQQRDEFRNPPGAPIHHIHSNRVRKEMKKRTGAKPACASKLSMVCSPAALEMPMMSMATVSVEESDMSPADPLPEPVRASEGSNARDSGIVDSGDVFVDVESEIEDEAEDYTRIPATIDQALEKLDDDAAVCPTIINIGTSWTKDYQRSLLAPSQRTTMEEDDLCKARNQAFDLLDALSRSGTICLDHSSLHVVAAATHSFDKTLVETVIQDSVNPIEKVERTSLIISSTIHQQDPASLIAPQHLRRVQTYSPGLFKNHGDESTS